MQQIQNISSALQLNTRSPNWLIAAFLAATWAETRKDVVALFLALWLSLQLYSAGKSAVHGFFLKAMPSSGSLHPQQPALNLKHSLQQMAIGLCGPSICFALFICLQSALGYLPLNLVRYFQLAALFNVYWALFQLLPMPPFDGHLILSGALEAIFGIRGFAASYFLEASIGTLLALLLSCAFPTLDAIARLLTCGVLAFLSHSAFFQWSALRGKLACDFDPKVQRALVDAQRAIIDHLNQNALKTLNDLETSLPMKSLALGHVCLLRGLALKGEGKYQEALDYLLLHRNALVGDALNLLHELAYKVGDHPLVCAMAGEVYVHSPRPEIAAINGLAFANLRDKVTAMHWLHCAKREGYETWRLLDDSLFQGWSRAMLNTLR